LNEGQLRNPRVSRAISALNSHDREEWFASFTQDATLTDDGKEEDFADWSDREIFGKGQGRLTEIKRDEHDGLTVYGTFHSAEWGSFDTVMRFHERGDRLSGLDVAQVNEQNQQST
jgi:hypothetical protein